jgi:subtilisin family serine protease
MVGPASTRNRVDRRLVAAAAVAIAVLGSAIGPASAAEPPGPPPAVEAAAAAVVAEAFEEAGLPANPAGEVKMVVVTENLDGTRKVSVRPADDIDEATDKVATALSTERVVSVSVDGPVHAFATIDALSQWPMSTPNSQYQQAWSMATGAGIVVAVLDTGVSRSHPDLPSTRVLTGAAYVGGTGQQTASNGNSDVHGHGTAVSGFIAATRGNSIGIAGVAPEVTILPVKVLSDSGSGSMSDVAAGVYYAVAQGADVINMSLGSSGSSAAVNTAIDYAVAQGVVVIAAAGNSGPNTINWPAAHPTAIAVGSFTSSMTLASHSSYSTSSPYVDLVAPGLNVTSLKTPLSSSYASNNYTTGAGTSYAAPHVAGIAALLRQVAPNATVAQVRSAIQATTIDVGTSGVDAATGYGYAQSAAAVTAIGGGRYDGPVKYVATNPIRITDVKPKAGASAIMQIAGVNGIPSNATTVVARVTAAKSRLGVARFTPVGLLDDPVQLSTSAVAADHLVELTPGVSGRVSVFNDQSTKFTVNVVGYYVPTEDEDEGQFVNVTRASLLDTRTGSGVLLANPGASVSCASFSRWDRAHAWYWTYKGLYGDVANLDPDNDGLVCEALAAKLRTPPATTMPVDLLKTKSRGTVEMQVLGRGGVPGSGVAAVTLEVSAIDPKGQGTVQILPGGNTSYGSWTHLSYVAKATTTTTVTVPVGQNGRVVFYTSSPTHLAVSVTGYVTT